jgi:hypothetical protein
MKTPREILLNRHQAAETKLDRIRRAVVADLRYQETAGPETPLFIAAALKLWRELILPARVTWAGIAAVWLVIGAMNLTQADQTTTVASAPSATPQDVRVARERQRELMLELALLPTTDPAMPPKPNPQPRSDRRSSLACV